MAVYRLDFGGALYGDVWQCRIHLNGEIDQDLDLLDSPDLQGALDDIEGDLKTWWAAGAYTSRSSLDWLKLNEINPDTGRYVSQSTTTMQEWTPVPGTQAVSYAPQLSLALSWHTGLRRGRAAKGRIFPPPQLLSFDNAGMVDPTRQQVCLDAGKTLIQNLNNWPGLDSLTDLNCIVLGLANEARATETGDASYNQHVKRNITAVAVGSLVDTQRRRRSALRETYLTADV